MMNSYVQEAEEASLGLFMEVILEPGRCSVGNMVK